MGVSAQSNRREQVAEINYWLGSDCLKTGYQVVVHRYRELPVDTPLLAYLDREMELDQQLTLKELIEDLPVHTRVTLSEEEIRAGGHAARHWRGHLAILPVVVLTIVQVRSYCDRAARIARPSGDSG